MTERYTSIALPGQPGEVSHYAERGGKTVSEMITNLKKRARRIKAEAEAVLAADDADFRIVSFTGVIRQRKKIVWQEGKK